MKTPGAMDTLVRVMGGVRELAVASYDDGQVFLNPYFYLEVVFLGIIMYVVTRRAIKPKSRPTLSEEQIEAAVAAWRPGPLVPEGSNPKPEYVIEQASGTRVTLQGDKVEYSNFVSHNFLGVLGSADVHKECKRVIEKYGVGSCGPRGFYGSIDVHIKCEEEIAKFMGTQNAILYSYDVATPSSVIPAFAKSGDFILADEGVNLSIKTGLYLSKSNVVFYKHLDMGDLESKLKDELARATMMRTPLNRRFIVSEGLFQNFGDIAPLKKLVELKEQYKFRLVLDESMSVGTLGKTGRGLAEHAGVAVKDVDILCASMSNAVASVGGFCVGDYEIVKHQRLSGAAYCYSASLPPYISQASITSLQLIAKEPKRVSTAPAPNVGSRLGPHRQAVLNCLLPIAGTGATTAKEHQTLPGGPGWHCRRMWLYSVRGGGQCFPAGSHQARRRRACGRLALRSSRGVREVKGDSDYRGHVQRHGNQPAANVPQDLNLNLAH